MECRAAVLAGGKAARMGRSKASVELGGRPLISYPLDAATAAGLNPFVVAKPASELPQLEARVVQEPDEPRHPLLGVVSALEHAEGAAVLVIACDLPFVTSELLAWLASLEEAVAVPEVGGRLHPLLARYGPGLAGPLRDALDAEHSMHDAVRALEPRLITAEELARFGDPERLAFNVNTPEDLARAEEIGSDQWRRT